jgi:hypothetical protein
VVRLRLWLFFACAFVWSGRAAATTVGLLRPVSHAANFDEALFRLQGELSAVGLAVALLDRPPGSDADSEEGRAWLERTATARGIDAFIDVIGDRRPVGVDIWIRERASRKLRVSRLMLEPDDDETATLAIRAIEVLRSNFLVLDLAGAGRARAPVPPPSRVDQPRPSPETSARFGLEAGAAALAGFDRVSPALLPFVRLGWAVRPWFGLEAMGAGFGTRPSIESAAGSASVAQSFGLFGLCLCSSAEHGLQPLFELSAGVLRTALDARASPPNVAHDVTRWTALADAGVGGRLGLPGRFYLTLAAHVQLAEPDVAIHFDDVVVATTGRPNLLLAVSAGARL